MKQTLLTICLILSCLSYSFAEMAIFGSSRFDTKPSYKECKLAIQKGDRLGEYEGSITFLYLDRIYTVSSSGFQLICFRSKKISD